jgi:hypothetical protein
MVSPFAFYWYSLLCACPPGIASLESNGVAQSFPSSALRHYHEPRVGIPALAGGADCLSGGIIGFLVCAVQVSYGSMPRRRGVVHSRNDSIMDTPWENYTVIFSRVDGTNRTPIPLSRITGLEAKMTPVVIADIDGERASLLKEVIPPRGNFWADITMPMF